MQNIKKILFIYPMRRELLLSITFCEDDMCSERRPLGTSKLKKIYFYAVNITMQELFLRLFLAVEQFFSGTYITKTKTFSDSVNLNYEFLYLATKTVKSKLYRKTCLILLG